MIVEAREDMLILSGSLTQNNWDSIRTAARLLLKRHPGGVIIDCGLIDEVTEDGIETFLDGLSYIETKKARIIVANVPKHVLDALKQVPGVKSQLPIAVSVEAARSSLTLSETSVDDTAYACSILIAINGLPEEVNAVHLSARVAMRRQAIIHLLYCIDVPRALPIGAPLAEQESHARQVLNDIEAMVKRHNVSCIRHVERGRDWAETTIKKAEQLKAQSLVITMPYDFNPANDPTQKIMHILHRAPCEVLVYRAGKDGSSFIGHH